MGASPRTALGALLWLILAPGTVAGLVPWSLTQWESGAALVGFPGERVLGAALVVAGAAAVIDLFARFVRQGLGTPAPYLLTRRLVVTGLYRHVRNPMYVAVVTVIAGQALFLGRAVLLGYAALVGAVFHVYVVLVEEPRLSRDFGAEYAEYTRAVRRWAPRWTPWKGGAVHPR